MIHLAKKVKVIEIKIKNLLYSIRIYILILSCFGWCKQLSWLSVNIWQYTYFYFLRYSLNNKLCRLKLSSVHIHIPIFITIYYTHTQHTFKRSCIPAKFFKNVTFRNRLPRCLRCWVYPTPVKYIHNIS